PHPAPPAAFFGGGPAGGGGGGAGGGGGGDGLPVRLVQRRCDQASCLERGELPFVDEDFCHRFRGDDKLRLRNLLAQLANRFGVEEPLPLRQIQYLRCRHASVPQIHS